MELTILNIISLIGSICSITGNSITFYVKKCLKFISTLFKRNLYKKKDDHGEQTKVNAHHRIEDSWGEWKHARAYIYSLPNLKSELLQVKLEMPNETTIDMIDANNFYIKALMQIIERLATFYSPEYFKNLSSQDFFEKIISERSDFLSMTVLPHGPNTGGTLQGILVGNKIIKEIEHIIENMVEGLHPLSSEGNSYSQWIKEWQQPRSQEK